MTFDGRRPAPRIRPSGRSAARRIESTAGRAFGEVAEDFDRVRPTYPDALIDDVVAYAPDGGRTLEIGAGTGKATVALLARGRPIVAVEPDPRLAEILARVTGGRVEIVPTTFERYRPDTPFTLLACADAWHWTEPATRWALAARALAPGGALALFGNSERVDDPVLRQAMLDVLAEVTPAIVVRDEPAGDPWIRWPGGELAAQPAFADRVARVYPSRRVVSGQDYLTHMSTRSQCRMLAAPVRERLFAALTDVFPAEVPLATESLLYLARVR